MQPGDVLARFVGPHQLGGDLVDVQQGRVHEPGVRRAFGEQFTGDQAARVQADRTGGEDAGAAHRDQVGGAGTRADEVHGHLSSPGACEVFCTDHWVTGMA